MQQPLTIEQNLTARAPWELALEKWAELRLDEPSPDLSGERHRAEERQALACGRRAPEDLLLLGFLYSEVLNQRFGRTNSGLNFSLGFM